MRIRRNDVFLHGHGLLARGAPHLERALVRSQYLACGTAPPWAEAPRARASCITRRRRWCSTRLTVRAAGGGMPLGPREEDALSQRLRHTFYFQLRITATMATLTPRLSMLICTNGRLYMEVPCYARAGGAACRNLLSPPSYGHTFVYSAERCVHRARGETQCPPLVKSARVL
jgi:hypothetical protein